MHTELGRCSKLQGEMDRMEGDLADLVISWSIDDIFDAERYRDKVKKIPDSFLSVEHYFQSFLMPLIEETRAELQSSLESLHEAPCAEVLSVQDAKSHSKRKPTSDFFYSIDIDRWVLEAGHNKSEAYKPKINDILVLSNFKPEIANDLNRYGAMYWLVCVTGVHELDEEDATLYINNVNERVKGLRIKASKEIEVTAGMGNSLYATFVTSIVTDNRIWKALQWRNESRDPNIVQKIVNIKEMAPDDHSYMQCDNKVTEIFDKLSSLNLNESQLSAVESSISNIITKSSNPVKIIWGPPGTGKTKTVSTLLCSLLKLNCRTLACAPTNVAVSEVCQRLLPLFKEWRRQEYDQSSPCPLGDVVLFGNRDHLKVDENLQEIYLDYRVDQLKNCFVPVTGWRHRLDSMIDLLQDGLRLYNISLENKIELTCIGFKEYLLGRFREVAEPFVECVNILWTHLPISFISKLQSANVFLLLCLLNGFEDILSRRRLSDKDVMEVFSELKTDADFGTSDDDFPIDFVGPTSLWLSRARKVCLQILRVLRSSVQLPYTAAIDSIREFCLRGATLYFCTASSSSLLFYVPVEDLDVLVIDEAAQLKECESTIPLRLRRLHHVVLIGDERQLPSVVHSQISMDAGFGRSLFERLVSIGHPKHLLNVQYRMHPAISSFPNAKFYDNQIMNGLNVRKPNYGRVYLPESMYGPFSFININDGREEKDEFGNSWKNMVEVAVVLKIIHRLHKEWRENELNLSIGVVSPYASQVHELCGKVMSKYDNQKGFNLTVKSIDGFQGGEEDIIILSTVRSSSGGSVGFLENHNRTNVALTRARHCLWVVGNASTLLRSGTIWKELVLDAKKRSSFFNADEDKALTKAIVDVKHELHQFGDLLSPDSVLLRTARWKVLFSDDFKKSFAKLKFRQIRNEIMLLLLRLADGWRPKNKADNFLDSFKLARQCRVRDIYLVYTVDIAKYEMYTQVIKVWDILPAVDIPKIAKRLQTIFAMYNDDYIEHCKAKCLDGVVENPMTWKVEATVNWQNQFHKMRQSVVPLIGEVESSQYMENSKVNDSLLLMKFYALSSGVVKHLLTTTDGSAIEIPFEVTDNEREIILFPRSAFILGRSGTGKTTVLTMKLIQKEQQHYISNQGLDDCMVEKQRTDGNAKGNIEASNEGDVKQVFVTVSPKLCSAIKNYISRLESFLKGGKFSGETSPLQMYDTNDGFNDFADIPDSFIDIPSKHYPLVITFQKFLIMLDGTVGDSFFVKFHDSKEVTSTSEVSKFLGAQLVFQNKQVNYEKFHNSYWPHFNSLWTRSLDPSTVFVQIISHIKGGLSADLSTGGKIQREDYINLSERRQSLLDTEQRERVYDIFLEYEREKLLKGEFDLSDFVTDLHRRLSSYGFPGNKIDFVYIDEVQDLTMRQISLFKYVCRNVLEGFVFAGDTAQTIAKGVDFRFQDIRSLFYNEFLSEVLHESKRSGKKEPAVSEIFHLNQNFRTHNAILRLSQSVVDLVCHFFPWSIDILKPEMSMIYGETPVILDSGDNNAIVTIFGNSENVGKSGVGFGAEQAIIVRDDNEKQKVISSVEKQALVLTIIECKGLEFQDVLLYNFFGSSPLRNHWRVTYNYMKELDLLDSNSLRFPAFDKYKHNLLSSELKQLYVAITRTRQRLWICESVNDFSRPMFDYWMKVGVIQVRHLDESLAQAMRVVSSADEWRMRGIKLFNEENFEMATMCFERAGDSFRENWSRAAGLCINAERILVSNFDAAYTAFTQAAEIYETIGKSEAAAKCFFKLKEYKKAGTIYKEKCGRLIEAGDCFVLAECWSLAAEVYATARCFAKCLNACSRGQLFEDGLSLIEQWEEDSSQDIEKIRTAFLESCAAHYVEIGDTSRVMKSVKAFPSLSLMRSFLKAHNMLNELIHVEIEFSNYAEAANIARSMGNVLIEAEVFEKSGDFVHAAKLVIFYIVSKSLWNSTSNGWPMKSFTNQDVLIKKVKLLSEHVSSSFKKYFSTKIELLFETTNWLKLWEVYDSSLELDSVFFKVFAARKIVDLHLQSDVRKYKWEADDLAESEQHVGRMISRCSCSFETLMYIWDLWKDQVLNIFSYLQSLDSSEDETFKSEYLAYEEFCLEYFGVQKEDNNFYVAHIPEAPWIRVSVDTNTMSNNVIRMNGIQFSSCVKGYWLSELEAVGLKVLQLLDSLYKFSTENSLPLFSQGKILLHIYKLSQFLNDSNMNLSKSNAWKLQRFLSLPSSSFFDIIFPFNLKSGINEKMVSLRDNETSKKILEEILLENLGKKPTHGQVGRVVMILFVIGKMSDELYRKIRAHFDCKDEWKAFIDQLNMYFDSGLGWPALVTTFSASIQSTYDTDWVRETDYINPHCFLYLVECLLFLASSWRVCNGYLFTTKTYVFEMLICSCWKGPVGSFLALPGPPSESVASKALDLIVDIAHGLLSNKQSMKKWLKKSHSGSPSSTFPVLTLRLVMIIILAHLNSGKYWLRIEDLFQKSSVISELPPQFLEKIQLNSNCHLHRMVAEALGAIDDPLVVVRPERSSELPNLHAIFVVPTTIQCRKELLEVVFPKKEESNQHDRGCTGHAQATSSSNVTVCTTECRSEPQLAVNALPEQSEKAVEDEPKNFHDDVHGKFEEFWGVIDIILSQDIDDVANLSSKVDCALDSATACLGVDENRPTDHNHVLIGEVKSMIDEWKHLYNSLDLRGKQPERIISALKEFGSEVNAKKPRLKSLLDLIFGKNDQESAIEAPDPALMAIEDPSSTIKEKEEHTDDLMEANEPAGNSVATVESKRSKKNKGKGRGKHKPKKKNKGGKGR